MGSSYSDLNLYFKLKTGTYGIPKNGQPNGEKPKDGNPKKYTVTVTKSNYDGCVNFEKVTHSITFKPPNKGTNYNIILCEGNESNKGKNIFGYYYPSTNNEVLKELHVYYSVLAPNDPLVVSFVTRGDQTHNFLYSGLLSTVWVRAYSIAYYSLGQQLSKELLKNEFRKSHRNRKIEFKIGNEAVQVSGFKQDLNNGSCYRYIYYPDGDKSVLGSDCLCKLDSKTPIPLDCPKPSETAKPAEAPSPPAASPAKSDAKTNSTPNYDNKIDPYYLDFVNGHHYDGVIFYFVINGNQGKPNNNSQSSSNAQAANGKPKDEKDNYDHNMAVLLELIDNCKPKIHLKRKDKLGNYWSQEQVKYNDDNTLKEALENIKTSADSNESTTFILEKKDNYKGVKVSEGDKEKKTFTKYTHKVDATNKPNFLFRKGVTKIGDLDTSKFKTKTLEVYFLKIGDNEQGYPFIIMITNEDESQSGAAQAEQQQQQQQQPPDQQQPQQQPQQQQQPAGAGGGQNKETKKCFFSSENYDFTKWLELEVDKKEDKDKKEKNGKQTENNQAKELEKKLTERLEKIEQYGKCTNDINILRSIAYQVLIGKDEPDTTKKVEPEPPEERPKVMPYTGDIGGTSLPVVLGSVAAGLVVLGIISAIIYGIYWYNTTIKLLT